MTYHVESRLFGRTVEFDFSGPWGSYWIVMSRLMLGWWFLYGGLEKYTWAFASEPFSSRGWLAGQFPAGADGTLLAQLRPDWLQALFDLTVNTPWLLAFTDVMIPLGELLIGLGLILGVATRLTAFFGATLLGFFYFGNADWAHGIVNGELAGVMLFIGLVVFGAGRILGGDAFLEKTQFVKNHPRMRYFLG